MQSVVNRKQVRRRIRYRVRRQIAGTAKRPRLAVFRSSKHIYVQAIDDASGRTLAAVSTVDPAIRSEGAGSNVEAARKVGTEIAGRLKQAGVETVIFDRGGFLFHGRVKALAEAAREAGLKF